jgi:PAS domain S-box-containing protein
LSQDGTRDDPPVEYLLDESAEELYEMAPCGYLTTTLDGRIIKVNRTVTEWLGYERDELTDGRRLVDLLTVGGKMFYETHFNLLLRMQRAVDEIALDIIRKDGRVLPTLINARQKRNAADEPVLNRFTIFNASERRRYERDLLAARDLLRTTLASIGDAVIATDAEGRITFMNPVAEELSGWKNQAALGKSIEEVLILAREDTGVRIENPITQAVRAGVIVGLANHTVLISREGRQIPIDDSASPIRDASGEVIGGVLVFRDISGRRKAEKELKQAHELLARRADELRRSNEDLSQFAHVASHDLRSPLSTITQYAQLLERRYGSQLAEGKELLHYLTSAAQRMSNLIEDLLSYARVSAEDGHVSAPVDANRQLSTAMENLRGAISASGATITHDALPEVFVDATSLLQIFQNLIGNAIHYRSAHAPRIHVTSADQNEQWLFSCKDNGIGIAPEFQTQIFEPFKRLHGTDRPGSGIGLAVCKRIVERYQGRIWVESEVNQGSTFFFTLPKTV